MFDVLVVKHVSANSTKSWCLRIERVFINDVKYDGNEFVHSLPIRYVRVHLAPNEEHIAH
jgi:hypothetical protein